MDNKTGAGAKLVAFLKKAADALRPHTLIIAAFTLLFSLFTFTMAQQRPGDASPPPSDTAAQTPSPSGQAPSGQPPSEQPPEQPSEQPPEQTAYNPLTGEALPSGSGPARRPTAVVLNNLNRALPMSGVSYADVIYEVLAEGGITRMLGVYYNPDALEKIGTVRSARTYYLELALGHDAIFVHAGGSYLVYDKIAEWGVATLDYVNGGAYASELAWRDPDRVANVGLEHSVYTSGERVAKAAERAHITAESQGFEQGWVFAPGVSAGSVRASGVNVHFTRNKTTRFQYDSAAGVYTAWQYDAVFYDEAASRPVTVANVAVLHTDVTAVPGDAEGRLDVRLTGAGTGYIASGGTAAAIAWRKDSRTAPLVFTYEDGGEVTLAEGKTYICVIGENMQVDFA
ncbi:MAG: DUF3048 domain-containing protein [Oscillospiraceae bacterium]|jgi:hypothetical protein|nr:DUF3048 domain-containing protein [Oscillospiraceae bacterium]